MGRVNAWETEQDFQETGITLREKLGIKSIHQHN